MACGLEAFSQGTLRQKATLLQSVRKSRVGVYVCLRTRVFAPFTILKIFPLVFTMTQLLLENLWLPFVHAALDRPAFACALGMDSIPGCFPIYFVVVCFKNCIYVDKGASSSFDFFIVLTYMIPKTGNFVVISNTRLCSPCVPCVKFFLLPSG